MTDQADQHFMSLAIEQALYGLNTTAPNPRVGCVIVDPEGVLLASGYHHKTGEAHAEVDALNKLDGLAQGAKIYVTLEPCSHIGRTGACADVLIKAGISELIYGMQDPNPLVSGQGLQRLREAGIAVRGPVLESEVTALNPGFIKRMNSGQPYVRLKLAMSFDGRTAMKSGESQWITGIEARQDVQAMRARSCAIVTGIGTVLHDDPALTVRSLEGHTEGLRQPLRVIVDQHLRTPDTAKALIQRGRAVIATTSFKRFPIGRAEIWGMPGRRGAVDIAALLKRLAEEQCNEVMVEAGPKLAGSFITSGLVDELIVYVAPKLMGSAARPLFELPIEKMADSVDLNITDVTPIGGDWRFTCELTDKSSDHK